MATIERFEDLRIWRASREICKKIYELALKKPFATDFDLKRQILRSSGSVMDNIAEGFDRQGNKEFIQFLAIAKGSCAEVRSQLARATDFKYLDKGDYESLRLETENLSKGIGAMMNHLRKSDFKGKKFDR